MQEIKELHHFFLHTTYRRIIPATEHSFGLASARTYPSDMFVAKYEPKATAERVTTLEERNSGGQNSMPGEGEHTNDGEVNGTSTSAPPVMSQSSLAAHVDESEFSYIITLNDDYKGGGTSFVHSREVVRPPKGSLILLSGSNMHEGLAVTEGTRYIVTGYLRYAGPING